MSNEIEDTDLDLEEEPESVRDSIEKAIEEVEAKEEAPPEAKTEEKAPIEEAPQKETNLQVETSPKKEAKAEMPILPPSSLSEEEKEAFRALPRHAQEATSRVIKDLTADYTRKTQELAKERDSVQNLRGALTPYEQAFRQKGFVPEQAIQELARVWTMLEANPNQGLQFLARQYGVDLSRVSQAAPPIDPHIASITNELQELKQLYSRQQQATQQGQYSQLEREVEAFTQETDENGNAKRPFVKDLEADMAVIVQHLKSQNPGRANYEVLQEAYEKAAWANPDTRKAMLERQTAEKETVRIKEVKAKTASAKRAGSSIKGAPGGTNSVVPDDLRATIEAAFEGRLD